MFVDNFALTLIDTTNHSIRSDVLSSYPYFAQYIILQGLDKVLQKNFPEFPWVFAHF